jgi:ribosomal protein S1
VDVGAKSEGIIRLSELTRDLNANPEDIVQVGETIRVVVVEPEGRGGSPVLSKRRADADQAWDKIEKARETGEILQAVVTQRVKGGLVVNLGMRGFVPASHVGSGSLKVNLDRYLNQTIPLKVIEVDKERQKIVLSNKLAVQEEREAKSAELKANLAPQQRRQGIVRRLTPYGAFVDLGGIDGLLHISEMSWTRINDPKEILKEGQEIEVMVLKVDLEHDRVSLGLKQILPDPWQDIASRYKEGDVITGKVTRIVPFGAFVQVEGGIEGIIPNAEMPRNRGGKGTPPPSENDTAA